MEPLSANLGIRVAGATCVGQRDNNEDAVFAKSGSGWALAAVSDGIGGEACGEVASQLAIQKVSEFFTCIENECAQGNVPVASAVQEQLTQLFRDANDSVCQKIESNREQYHGMGATLVVAMTICSELYVAHMGDSRAYLLRNGACFQLTTDHNLKWDNPELAEVPEMYGAALTRSLGVAWPAERNVTVSRPLPDMPGDDCLSSGDIVLVCSDGISDELSAEDILACLKESNNIKTGLIVAIRRACGLGGDSQDNATAAGFEIGEFSREKKTIRRAKLPSRRELRSWRGEGRSWGRMALTACFTVLLGIGLLIGWQLMEKRAAPSAVDNSGLNGSGTTDPGHNVFSGEDYDIEEIPSEKGGEKAPRRGLYDEVQEGIFKESEMEGKAHKDVIRNSSLESSESSLEASSEKNEASSKETERKLAEKSNEESSE